MHSYSETLVVPPDASSQPHHAGKDIADQFAKKLWIK